jgi:hypothetical protein
MPVNKTDVRVLLSGFVPPALTVPDTIFVDNPCTATVPVPAGSVIVPDAVADGDNVVVPDDEPFMAKLETVVVPAIVCPPAVVSMVPVAAGTVIVFEPATAVGASVI